MARSKQTERPTTNAAHDLLASKIVPEEVSRQFIHNATNSPLFTLPPELRNRIWQPLFGRYTIHIWNRNADYRRYECIHDEDDVQAATAIKNLDPPVSTLVYSNRHNDCYNHHGKRFSYELEMLTVCRQIHQETALMPFTNSVFSFESDPFEFIDRLILAQACAIKSAVFGEEIQHHEFARWLLLLLPSVAGWKASSKVCVT
ncbi:hypothetical protein LTR78_009092 [Recurvomyces mirabilis]|uniref:DUF7730 domain-containing protein n=1 Tax=Recurvomyces mirabilis TaxID=574656 RepID=A0AAE0TS55_9PEZI|nr:hypothetical protein LTR78_009092 [Recurvomyces mirabilis]KAK5161030.1 hypothetical protein LTS14_000824 [Recurvomyces mirabilis]